MWSANNRHRALRRRCQFPFGALELVGCGNIHCAGGVGTRVSGRGRFHLGEREVSMIYVACFLGLKKTVEMALRPR
jgi:hypothetical protein